MIPKRLLPDVRLNDDIPKNCDEYYEWKYQIDTRIQYLNDVLIDTIGEKFLSGRHGAIPFHPSSNMVPSSDPSYVPSVTFFVDWGDGTQETISRDTINADTSINQTSPEVYNAVNRNLIHEYSQGGKYTITIGCNKWNAMRAIISRSSFGFPQTRDVSSLTSTTYLSEWYKIIFQATLIRVLTPLPIFNLHWSSNLGSGATTRIYDMNGDYVYPCEDYAQIGSEYRKYTMSLGFTSGFYGCYKLKSIPSNLFLNYSERTWEKYKESGQAACSAPLLCLPSFFQNCKALKKVPKNLLHYCPYLTNCQSLFESSGLTEINFAFFKKNPNLINVDHCFYSTNLKSVPSELFKNNSRIQNMDYTFKGCNSLTYLAQDLFEYSDYLITAYNTFDWTREDTNYPSYEGYRIPLIINGSFWKIKSPYALYLPFPMTVCKMAASDLENPGQVKPIYIYSIDVFNFSVPEKSYTYVTLLNKGTISPDYRDNPAFTKKYQGVNIKFWNRFGFNINGNTREDMLVEVDPNKDKWGGVPFAWSSQGIIVTEKTLGIVNLLQGMHYATSLDSFPEPMRSSYSPTLQNNVYFQLENISGIAKVLCLEKGWCVSGYRKVLVNGEYYYRKVSNTSDSTVWSTYVKNYLGEESSAYTEYLAAGGQLTPPTNP